MAAAESAAFAEALISRFILVWVQTKDKRPRKNVRGIVHALQEATLVKRKKEKRKKKKEKEKSGTQKPRRGTQHKTQITHTHTYVYVSVHTLIH